MSTVRSAERSVKQVAASRPFKIAARAGIVAYGVTHLLIAWLALRVAFGGDDTNASQQGAFAEIGAQPAGRLLLWLVVCGFAAVALWQLSAALWGFHYLSGNDRVRARLASAGKAVLYAGLAGLAGRVAVEEASGDNGQGVTAAVLSVPGGQLLVGAVGLGILVTGAVIVYRGWTAKFTDDMDLGSVEPTARRLLVRLGQVGWVAKGLAIAVLGVLVTLAAITFDAQKANGLDAALKTLAAQPFGAVILTTVALGLACFGAFLFVDARYHRV